MQKKLQNFRMSSFQLAHHLHLRDVLTKKAALLLDFVEIDSYY